MADEETRITLRLPTELRDRLSEAGRDVGRSLNSEIVTRLEGSLRMQATLTRSVEEHEKTIEETLHLRRQIAALTESFQLFLEAKDILSAADFDEIRRKAAGQTKE